MREVLAAHAHDMWSGWMQYLFSKSTINKDGTMTIPAWAVNRWTRQADTNYSDLPEEEKESDLKEADGILKIIQPPNQTFHRDAKSRCNCDLRGVSASTGGCPVHGIKY